MFSKQNAKMNVVVVETSFINEMTATLWEENRKYRDWHSQWLDFVNGKNDGHVHFNPPCKYAAVGESRSGWHIEKPSEFVSVEKFAVVNDNGGLFDEQFVKDQFVTVFWYVETFKRDDNVRFHHTPYCVQIDYPDGTPPLVFMNRLVYDNTPSYR